MNRGGAGGAKGVLVGSVASLGLARGTMKEVKVGPENKPVLLVHVRAAAQSGGRGLTTQRATADAFAAAFR
jgi:hypothetical protein